MQSDVGLPEEPLLPRTTSKLLLEPPRFPLRGRSWRLAFDGSVTTADGANWWALLPILFGLNAGLALVLPALPNLKLRFFEGDAPAAASAQSLMESVRAALICLVSGELGRLSDAVGRRPLVLLSVICTLAPLVSLLLTSNLYIYFVLFSLAGALGGQSSPIVYAYVADCCPERVRARSFGVMGAMVGSVYMVIPPIGAFIGAYFGHQALFAAAVSVEMLAVASVFLLRESLPDHKRQNYQVSTNPRAAVEPLMLLLRRRGSMLWWLAIVRFLLSLSFSGLMTVSSFSFAALLSLSDVDFGVVMSVQGGSAIIGQVLFIRLFIWLGFEELALLFLGVCMGASQAMGLLMLGWYPRKIVILVSILVGAGGAVERPAFNALLTKGLDEDIGLTLGMFTAVDGLATCIAPFMFSIVFACGPLYPFAVAAVLQGWAATIIAGIRYVKLTNGTER